MTNVRVEIPVDDPCLRFEVCKMIDLEQGDLIQFNKAFTTKVGPPRWSRFRLFLSGAWLKSDDPLKQMESFFVKFLTEEGKVEHLYLDRDWIELPIVRRLIR